MTTPDTAALLAALRTLPRFAAIADNALVPLERKGLAHTHLRVAGGRALVRIPLGVYGNLDPARSLERELWEHFVERSPHVPRLRELSHGGVRRVSLLNLAEHILRLWGPPPKPRKPPGATP